MFFVICMVVMLQALLGACNPGDVPSLFVFGDSLVDAGNNNYLLTTVKPLFPNGIDFGYPYGIPSGRFTNGRSVIDLIGQAIGLNQLIPAFLNPRAKGDAILKGVNYASAASGIMNSTEWFLGKQMPLDVQISCFEKTKHDIISTVGEAEATKLFRTAIFLFVAGSNDVMFGPVDSSSWEPFLDLVVSRFGTQITRLHALGARKIVVANSPGIGCIPFQKALHHSGRGCVIGLNRKAEEFNVRVRALLTKLTMVHDDSTFVYANVYDMLDDILKNYLSYGFEVADVGCCHVVGLNLERLVPCGTTSKVCRDRSKYVFWDAFHLTERAYGMVARQIVDGGLNYMSPVNLRQLLNFL